MSLSVGSASSDRSFTILLHLGGCLLVRVVWCVVSCYVYLSYVSSVSPLDLLSVLHVCLLYCQPSARSEIAESMLILESLSITHQRLRVSLSVSLFLYLSFSLLGYVVLESCVV